MSKQVWATLNQQYPNHDSMDNHGQIWISSCFGTFCKPKHEEQ